MAGAGQNTKLVTTTTAWHWRLSKQWKASPWLSFSFLGDVPWITFRWILRCPCPEGCSRPGSSSSSLQQLWSMLVMALSMALFVLRVLGVANAFSFPPSLSSQDIPKHNPWPECYLCFPMGFFLIMYSCTLSGHTCSLFITSRKVLSLSWKLIDFSIKLVVRNTL